MMTSAEVTSNLALKHEGVAQALLFREIGAKQRDLNARSEPSIKIGNIR